MRIRSVILAAAIVVMASIVGQAQEQKVLWRQIKIGTYSVTWPASQGAASTCLTNDGSGALSWGTCSNAWQAVGGIISQVTATDHVKIGGGTTVSELRFMEASANGTNYVGFKAPATIAANKVWELPSADGTNGQVMATNGSGVLSWSSSGGTHPDPHLLAAGTEAAPAYSFSAQSTMGMYRVSSNVLGFTPLSTGGGVMALDVAWWAAPRLSLISNVHEPSTIRTVGHDWTTLAPLALQVSQLHNNATGTDTAPAYSFGDQPTMGIWRSSANVLGITPKSADGGVVLIDLRGTAAVRLSLLSNTHEAGTIRSVAHDSTTLSLLAIQATGVIFPSLTQANLGSPENGVQVYCSDCTAACAASGTGAMAMRINGAWKCIQ